MGGGTSERSLTSRAARSEPGAAMWKRTESLEPEEKTIIVCIECKRSYSEWQSEQLQSDRARSWTRDPTLRLCHGGFTLQWVKPESRFTLVMLGRFRPRGPKLRTVSPE